MSRNKKLKTTPYFCVCGFKIAACEAVHDGVAVIGWSLVVGDGTKGNTDADDPKMGHPPVPPPTAANLCRLLLDKKVVHRVYITDPEFLVVGEVKQAHEHDRNR